MRFALIDSVRCEANPGHAGVCPHCGSVVIAKCGSIKVGHWAHKSRRNCDSLWEPETPWHRSWKDVFPIEWQEHGRRDPIGELHIADVLTPQELALEFQHSPIKRDEVEVRTNFHGNICWIVDGLRLENSLKQFSHALDVGYRIRSRGAPIFQRYHSDSLLLKKWSGLNAPIVFDFGGEDLWIIGRSDINSSYVYPLRRPLLVREFKRGNRPPPIQNM
ncbi:competence protein CoiA [Shimia marina]|uniref:Competence protein n=1 Tax=Shimia marina TaxID=321267 RepID=A0A0P1EJV4_9RHOB|nr:Competence protein [Shimia marina]SFE65504.1 Competence protein CoiA-like family protein [Shimia marina]